MVATTGALLGVLWAVFAPLRTMRELPGAGEEAGEETGEEAGEETAMARIITGP